MRSGLLLLGAVIAALMIWTCPADVYLAYGLAWVPPTLLWVFGVVVGKATWGRRP